MQRIVLNVEIDFFFVNFRNVRSSPDLGKSVSWPTPPKAIETFINQLKNVHGR